MREGERRLSDANRETVKAEFLETLEILESGRSKFNIGSTVDRLSDRFNLFDDRGISFVREVERLDVFSSFDNSLGDFNSTLTAERKAVGQSKANTEFSAAIADDVELFVDVGVEVVDGHNDVRTETLQVFDMSVKVAEALLEGFCVGLADFRKRYTTVPLEALVEVTSTTAAGLRPAARHLML